MAQGSKMTSLTKTAFSNDGVEVILRQVESSLSLESECARRESTEAQLRSYYEIEQCREFIVQKHYQRIALQFPDHLLCDAARVASLLAQETLRTVFILGDTSYGSCCVDETAAEHVAADSIIHFGPSCLTWTRRLPVLFVFGKEEIDVKDCEQAFRDTFVAGDELVLLLYDTVYYHCLDKLARCIADYNGCVMSELVLPQQKAAAAACACKPIVKVAWESPNREPCSVAFGKRHGCCRDETAEVGVNTESATSPLEITENATVPDKGITKKCEQGKAEGRATAESTSSEGSHCFVYNRFGRYFQLQHPVEDYKIFYIGREGSTLNNLILNYNRCQFFTYNPITRKRRQETMNVNKALRRRYFLVQKAKEARTVGILVGTLGAANYLEIIERLKTVLREAGKKYYTVAVGKLNTPKMANFLEIDLFVLVACPENSLVDSQEFFKPVITPFEMEMACIRSKEWTGDYSTDFQELLPGAAFHTALGEGLEVEDEVGPEFSLITGGFVPTKETNQLERGHEMAMVTRPQMEVALPNTAAAHLQKRSWQGLEQKLGETLVTAAVEGRTGIAAAYMNETQ